MSDGRTHLSVEGGIAHISFDRPQARNAMTWKMYDELAEACEVIGAQPQIRVAVLRGTGGRAFLAGTDIEQFKAFSSGEDGVAYEKKVDAYIRAVETLPVPTLAIVEGWAVGGGLAIANACDIRIATPGARFGVPIAATLGNCLSTANIRRLLSTLGESWVKRMLVLAEMPTAEDLAPSGYVAAVVAPEALDAHVIELCERLCGHAPLTMRATRQAVLRIVQTGTIADEDIVRGVYGSEDFRGGVSAFSEKRKALWRGR